MINTGSRIDENMYDQTKSPMMSVKTGKLVNVIEGIENLTSPTFSVQYGNQTDKIL
tara:strand:+ start:539 stop:706 length:168 start_codon:yes stop_codon:yes gene_type:complete